eukprot:GFUD01097234.1.p1 GENE.GFUD01097234.1~~GFUD01097234.1.p1  ORF type:complete len:156 (+),score=37.51 GFUD01097234.1:80-547(+)
MPVATPLTTPLLTISLLIAMSSSSTAKAVAPRQPVAPWPLALPPQDGNLRALAAAKGAGRFFSVWAKLATTNLAEEKPEAGEAGWTVFTISDEAWLNVIPQGTVDPLELDRPAEVGGGHSTGPWPPRPHCVLHHQNCGWPHTGSQDQARWATGGQ